MNFLANFGTITVDSILTVARLLTHEWAPGWVALLFLVLLLICSVTFFVRTQKSTQAINTFKKIILSNSRSSSENDDAPLETSFKDNYGKIQRAIKSFAEENPKPQSIQEKIVTAWNEYSETLDKEGDVIQNSLRPDLFFNKEDLGIAHNFSKMMPSIFVSAGLFFTFLGLVSALDQASHTLSDGGAQEALSKLLSIATAKFIMSLTGLLCSILFSILYKYKIRKIDTELHSLCTEIEKRLTYQSLESVAEKQLKALEAQKDYFEILGDNITAAIAQNIKTIPDAIIQGISPIADSIQNSSTSGVNQMVSDISKQLSGGFESSLAQVGSIVEKSAHQLSELTDSLQQNSRNMGVEFERSLDGLSTSMGELKTMMSQSAEQTVSTLNQGSETLLSMMNETLSEIRDNSAQNATLLQNAAEQISQASDNFSQKLEASSEKALQTAETELTGVSQKIASNISQEASNFAEQIQGLLTSPVHDLTKTLEGLNTQITVNSQRIDGHSSALHRNTESAKIAQDAFTKTIADLKDISAPIQDSLGKTERSTLSLSQSVQEINGTFEAGIAANNESVLKAFEYFTNSANIYQQAIEKSLEAINIAVKNFSSIVDRYDDIDDKLGDAFQKIETTVQASLANLDQYNKESQDKQTKAVTLLRSAISELAPFQPQHHK